MQIGKLTENQKKYIIVTFKTFQKTWPDERGKNIAYLAKEYQVTPNVIEAVLAEKNSFV